MTAWVASAGIVGIAVGFAAKDTLANLFAGIFILMDTPYKVGDMVVDVVVDVVDVAVDVVVAAEALFQPVVGSRGPTTTEECHSCTKNQDNP